MQVITKNENKILLLIKNNLDKYPEKIPYNKIKDILELSETSLIDLLEALQEKNFIKLDSDAKEVHYIDLYLETKVVEDKSALKSYMLNKTEEDAYVIIQNVISKYNGYAPRYVLEGALLYGELELSPKRTYNITVSLENKNLLKKVKRADGEYYTI
ncbi:MULTISPECIES: hypothetical protein [Methanosphaera]|uniref:Uncharacterized protein n=2 Tax=Methanosphaera stadtmanae TaxID=2317 RepID=Q2NFD0_METST|nr:MULTISPECIES: hypothetical protein [Methanosphaera]ABC57473.1 hypothetical protein Msp_1090 [Methanosphaera stadtmanae DSM 3091]MEE0489494.1 hypothetical protein [Methanosphaera stadtmanae]OEC88703.1 hypothetical protein A9758_03600 [Methanosphaera sp. A6]RAP02864.1 hypothetical protein CA615_05410 [Methanosphaera stadtmanae]RAP46901.1 MAG: hypothetical protein BZ132_05185 [Methanosphaera sp. DEW79]